LTINDHNTKWQVTTFINNIGNGGVGGFNADYTSPCIQYSFFSDCYHNSDNNWLPIPIASTYKNNGLNNELVMVQNQNHTLTYINFSKDFNSDNTIKTVTQSGGAIVDEITYKTMEPGLANNGFGAGTDLYSSGNNSFYPSIELKQIPSMKLVLKLKNTSLAITKFQDFKYNGYVINIGRVGVIGFNKTARSSWYLSPSDKKSWVVSINDPLKRGANLRNYSVLLNSGSEFDFNANYTSERMSATDNIFYQTTDPITKCCTILLKKQTTTDYLSNVINEKIYNIYSPVFLLPVSVTSKNYLGTRLHGEVTTITEYDDNITGIGNNYYIGRPKEINATSKVYVNTPVAGVADTKTSNEKIFYINGNISRTEKTPNGDAVTLIEKMEYFSNNLLKSKEISATGTPEAVALVPKKISYTYDATNRFIKTTTDAELMVTTNLTYHPLYGSVLTQKNPFNKTSTSVYDNWGKQTKITDFLGKSITYSYTRLNNIYTTTQTGDDGTSSIVEQDLLAREIRKGSKNITGNWVYIKPEYDNWGRKYRISEPYYGTASPTAWNTTEYDTYSRPIKTTAQTGQITNITYSGLSVTSNDGLLIKSITKNANGQTIANTDTPGGTIAYKYDAAGNMVESDYNGIKNTITYDNFGRKTQLVDTSAGTYTYSYNAFGEAKTEATPKGITTYTYTPVGKVLTKTVQGLTSADVTNIAITYYYDPITKFLTSMVVVNPNDGNSNYNYVYDTTGTNPTYQLKQTTENLYPVGSTIPFATFIKILSFDLFGRTDTETSTASSHGKSSSKVIKNVYSTVNGELIQKKDNVTSANIWLATNVNARGQITNTTLGNGVTVTNDYDAFGYNSSTRSSLGINNFMSFTNVFEPQKGNLISRYNSLFEVNETFSYDNLDRLKDWSNNYIIQNYTFTGNTESFLPTTSNVILTNTTTSIYSRLTVTTSSNFEGTKRKVKDNASIGDVIEFTGGLIYKNTLISNTVGELSFESITYSIVERDPSTGQTIEIGHGSDFQSNTFSFQHTVSQYSEIYLKIVAGNETNFQYPITFHLDNIKVREIKTLTQTYDDRGRITANNLGQYNYTTMAKPYQNTSVTLTPEANSYYSIKQLQSISYNAFKAPIQIEEPGIDKISFGYNAMQQRSVMYYGNTNNDKLTRPFRKYYSADGCMEIKATFTLGNPLPTAVEFITYIGGDAYSAPAVVKSNGTTQAYFYLHRDYQGSILAITNTVGAIVEKRLFDPWGNVIKVQNGAGVILAGLTFFDRGYTGHEHLQSVGLINMNARLYDPKLHRFLQPDALIQDPSNTQNYNRYAYCVNNPLKYTDISGNDFGITAFLIAVAVAMTTYTMTALLADVPFTVGGLIQCAVIAAVSCAVTFGIGEVFRTTANLYIKATYAALAHGAFQGGMSAAQGGKFWAGFAAGALSSIASSAIQMGSTGINTDGTDCVTNFGATMNKPAIILATGAIMGGAGSAIGGGNFWQGAVTGLVVAGFNHLAHPMDSPDDDVRINTKNKTAEVTRTGDGHDRIFVDGVEVMATPRGALGPELRDNGYSISMKGPQGVGMGLTDLVLDTFEILTGGRLLKMGLTTVPKIGSVGLRAMKVGDASGGMLKSSAFFTKHLRGMGMNYSFGRKLPTIYKPASNMGTFLGRNSPIIGGSMMFHGGYNLYNGR
jgi:RHS repeat-associated protein